jgi:hypothetical protein
MKTITIVLHYIGQGPDEEAALVNAMQELDRLCGNIFQALAPFDANTQMAAIRSGAMDVVTRDRIPAMKMTHQCYRAIQHLYAQHPKWSLAEEIANRAYEASRRVDMSDAADAILPPDDYPLLSV